MPIKPKIGKWYWIEDPGSNLHRGYTGPAKCIKDTKESNYCGGPTYDFEFFDKDGGEKGEGGYETTGWGDEDIVRECEAPLGHVDMITLESLRVIVQELANRVQILEKQVETLNDNCTPYTISG
jgi:hypothetical protein